MPVRKKVITRKEWETKLKDSHIWTKDMNKLVMNFLLNEGFALAAKKFQLESGTEPDMDLKIVEDRKALMETILSGNIEDAIRMINDWKPQLLDMNDQLDFHLQQQRLIEIIRCRKIEEALEFARKLAPRAYANPSFKKEFERTMTLMVLKDVKPGCYGELLDVSQCAKTAKEMDVAILTSEGHDKDSLLSSLLRMLIWAQKQLDEKAAYPHIINLRTASLEDPAI